MANNENLIPPKKGEPSRNPNGRPKGSKNRSTILNKWLSVKVTIKNPITKESQKVTVEDEVILALIREARKGNVVAIKEIQDTRHGKIVDKSEVSGPNGGPIETTSTLVIQGVSGKNDSTG